jgi:hypothetical protein
MSVDSGTFWAMAAVVVGVVAIPAGAWAAFRSARPRRTLRIIVDSAGAAWSALSLVDGYDKNPHRRGLGRPYVATVDIVSRGAMDIPAAAFGGSPLELEFGVRILAVVDQVSDAGRPAVRPPGLAVAGTALHVGPALLTRRHRLHYSVLLADAPQFRVVGELADVRVRAEHAGERASTRETAAFWTAEVSGLLFVVNLVANAGRPTWLTLGLNGLSLVAVGLLVFFWRRRHSDQRIGRRLSHLLPPDSPEPVPRDPVDEWVRVLSASSYLPMSYTRVRRRLQVFADALSRQATNRDPGEWPAHRIGRELAQGMLITADSFQAVLEVIVPWLESLDGAAAATRSKTIAALVGGFNDGTRDRVLDEQQVMTQALLRVASRHAST